MKNVQIALAVLMEPGALIERVPAAQIWGGTVPQGTPFPHVLVRSISSNDWVRVAPGVRRYVDSRVQVTVRASTYLEKGEILELVEACCRDRFGDWEGATAVTIHLDTEGPDFEPDPGTYEQSRDLMISFTTLN